MRNLIHKQQLLHCHPITLLYNSIIPFLYHGQHERCSKPQGWSRQTSSCLLMHIWHLIVKQHQFCKLSSRVTFGSDANNRIACRWCRKSVRKKKGKNVKQLLLKELYLIQTHFGGVSSDKHQPVELHTWKAQEWQQNQRHLSRDLRRIPLFSPKKPAREAPERETSPCYLQSCVYHRLSCSWWQSSLRHSESQLL